MISRVTLHDLLKGDLERRLRKHVCRLCHQHFEEEAGKPSLSDRIERSATRLLAENFLDPQIEPMFFRARIIDVVCEDCLKKFAADFPTDQEVSDGFKEVACVQAEFASRYPQSLKYYEAEAARKAQENNFRKIAAMLEARIGSLTDEAARRSFFVDLGLGPGVNEIPFGGKQVKEIREALKQIGTLYRQHQKVTGDCEIAIRNFRQLANIMINELHASEFHAEIDPIRRAFQEFERRLVTVNLPVVGRKHDKLIGDAYYLRLETIRVVAWSNLYNRCRAICDKFNLYYSYPGA